MSAGRAMGLILGVAADGAARGQKRTASRAPSLRGAVLVLGWGVDRLGRNSLLLRTIGTAMTTWGALGGAALASQGTALARELESDDLVTARRTLSALDPRCADSLDRVGLTRASVEAIAQSTSSAVVAPLMWGAVAGAPGMIAYSAVKYGKAAVARHGRHRVTTVVVDRVDELADVVPTRCASALTVAAAPVVGGSARGSWLAWRRDSAAHPSPNAGRVEAAFAGALEIRLGGRIVYPDRVQELPVLGAGRNPDAGHVTRAVELSRLVGWLGALSCAVLALGFGKSLRRRRG